MTKSNKVYFVKVDEDEVLYFDNYSDMKNYLEEAVWEQSDINHWKIFSVEETAYVHPVTKIDIEVPK